MIADLSYYLIYVSSARAKRVAFRGRRRQGDFSYNPSADRRAGGTIWPLAAVNLTCGKQIRILI
jgi:hypothetical protein